MTITASYHFEVQDLWVQAELLGAKFERACQGHRCWLEFPEDEQSFTRGQEPVITGWSGKVGEPRQRAAVTMVRVTVELDCDITAAQLLASREGPAGDMSLYKECSDVARAGIAVAQEVLSDLIKFVRTSGGQYWLEPLHKRPRLTWITSLYDSAGERMNTGPGVTLTAHEVLNTTMTREDVAEYFAAVDAGREPDLASEMLADAAFYADRASQPNPRISLLFAAIAAEVRIKTFLVERARPEQEALVDLLVKSRPPAASLYDKALKAVVGRSLREDDRELYDAVDRLFTTRNTLAHKGQLAGSARAEIAAARGASAYLDTLA